MLDAEVFWSKPQGKGIALLMALFLWSGLMLAWGLLEMDFSGGLRGLAWSCRHGWRWARR